MKNVRTQAFFFLLTILLSTAVAVFLSAGVFGTEVFVESGSLYLYKILLITKNITEVRTVHKLVA